MDVATLGLRVEADPAVRAVEQYERSLEELDRTADRVEKGQRSMGQAMREAARGQAQTARDAAVAYTTILERTFQNDMARIKEAQVRGFLKPSEAAAEGRAAAIAYNQAVVATLDQGRATRGTFSGPAGTDAFNQVAGSLKNVDEAAARASIGTGRLNNSLVALFTQAAGTHPVVGRLVDVVASFAIGGLMMTGVLAALAALAFGWRKVTQESREAKAALDEARDTLEAIAREQKLAPIGGELGASVRLGIQELNRLNAERETLREPRGNAPTFGEAGRRWQSLSEEMRDLQTLIEAGEQELGERQRAENERQADLLAAQEREAADARAKAAKDAQDALYQEFLRNQQAGQQNLLRQEIAGRAEAERLDESRAAIIDYFNEVTQRFKDEEEKRTKIAKEEAEKRAAQEREIQKKLAIAIIVLQLGAQAAGRDSRLGGALSGAASGAAQGAVIGSVIPGVGTLAGGIIGGGIGFLGGFFGGGGDDRRRQEAQQRAYDAAALRERQRELTEDLGLRRLQLTGDDDAAARMALTIRQRREMMAASQAGLGGGALRDLSMTHALERLALEQEQANAAALKVAEEQLGVLEDQLSKQEQTVESLRRVSDSLRDFGDSLKVSSLSILTPLQQLDEARKQFEMLRSLAMGGDVTAAESLPEAARMLLELSRSYNASGAGYVADFMRVQSTIDLVAEKFSAQAEVEQLMLDELRAQKELLEEQIETLRTVGLNIVEALDKVRTEAEENSKKQIRVWREPVDDGSAV